MFFCLRTLTASPLSIGLLIVNGISLELSYVNGFSLVIEAHLCIVNFAAPSLLKSEFIPCILNLVGRMVSANAATSAAAFILPIFANNDQNLFQEEYGLLRTLSNVGCAVEIGFQLMFDAKTKVDTLLLLVVVHQFSIHITFHHHVL